MGKIENGINGGFSGKVGPVVGTNWRGIDCMRSKPRKRKKRKKSEKLKATNNAFGFLNTFLTPFQAFIKIGFKQLAIMKTERNVAHSLNYYNNLVGPYPALEIDYSKLVLSKGDLPGVSDPQVVLNNNVLNITWEPNMTGDAAYNDQVMLTVYHQKKKRADGFIGAASRNNKSCSFELKANMMTDKIEVYFSLASWDRSLVSNTQYLGPVIIT